MNPAEIKQTLRQCYPFYITGFVIIFGLKYFYSHAEADELLWLLTPTTRWVSALSGISFTYEPEMGYVNHTLKYVIAPSCCGIQFLIITIALLLFSFVHRVKRKARWVLNSIGISYLFTVFVNGLRILTLFFVPQYFETHNLYNTLLTPERLHTIIGTAVYFAALLLIYGLVDSHFLSKSGLLPYSLLPPVFWYFFIVLGIPFLNHAYQKGESRFLEYTLLIASVCGAVLLPVFLLSLIRRLRRLLFPQ